MTDIYEQEAGRAFDAQAPYFDNLYSENLIIKYKRSRVREHLSGYLNPASTILELNAGTGEDAIYLAEKGHQVHATDLSTGMLSVMKNKIGLKGLQSSITTECRSYTDLENLEKQGPYDHIFSNFAGLNCTNELDKVLDSFLPLLKEDGKVTLVLLPKFCLWETLLLFRGKFKTAFRRFGGRRGAAAKIEDHKFNCWYYNPSYISRYLKPSFKVMKLEGLCTFVPPSYIENFTEKRPRLFSYLEKKENKYKSSWPWRSIGDYFIITLQRK